jgi:hypothetical protein
MSEHGAAEAVAAHMALSDPSAEVWRRVAHGELSAQAGAARVLEGREVPDEGERAELERAKQVFAPPTAKRREELLEALLERRREQEGEVVVSLAERAAKQGARASKGWVVGLLAAAAAAVLVVWMMPGQPLPEPERPQAFVAGYGIELAGMTLGDRGGSAAKPKPGELPRFDVDRRIGVGLRPDDVVEGPIAVVGFARERSGEVRRLEFEAVVHESGKVDIDAPVRALGLHEGEWELVFAVGRPGNLPSSWEALTAGETDGATGYEVVRTRVEIVPMRERGR